MTNEKKTEKKAQKQSPKFEEGLRIIKKDSRVSSLVANIIQNPPPPKNKKPKKTESSES